MLLCHFVVLCPCHFLSKALFLLPKNLPHGSMFNYISCFLLHCMPMTLCSCDASSFWNLYATVASYCVWSQKRVHRPSHHPQIKTRVVLYQSLLWKSSNMTLQDLFIAHSTKCAIWTSSIIPWKAFAFRELVLMSLLAHPDGWGGVLTSAFTGNVELWDSPARMFLACVSSATACANWHLYFEWLEGWHRSSEHDFVCFLTK